MILITQYSLQRFCFLEQNKNQIKSKEDLWVLRKTQKVTDKIIGLFSNTYLAIQMISCSFRVPVHGTEMLCIVPSRKSTAFPQVRPQRQIRTKLRSFWWGLW